MELGDPRAESHAARAAGVLAEGSSKNLVTWFCFSGYFWGLLKHLLDPFGEYVFKVFWAS